MVKTAAERSREYRERLKKKAAAGDKHALELVEKRKKRSSDGFSRSKTFINRHATKEQLNELQKLIQKKLNK